MVQGFCGVAAGGAPLRFLNLENTKYFPCLKMPRPLGGRFTLNTCLYFAIASTGSIFNHFCFESNLVHLIDDLFLCHLIRVIKDISSFSPEVNACLFHSFKPFQGFSNDQWSCSSGHALDFEADLVCDSLDRGGSHNHCQRYHQNG